MSRLASARAAAARPERGGVPGLHPAAHASGAEPRLARGHAARRGAAGARPGRGPAPARRGDPGQRATTPERFFREVVKSRQATLLPALAEIHQAAAAEGLGLGQESYSRERRQGDWRWCACASRCPSGQLRPARRLPAAASSARSSFVVVDRSGSRAAAKPAARRAWTSGCRPTSWPPSREPSGA